METETVEINIGDITITFYNAQGEPLQKGCMARCHRFIVEGAGIDPNRVKSITIPTLDYDNPDLVTVKIELYPQSLIDEAEHLMKPVFTKILKEDEHE
jgi:hypothetical protein